MGLPVISEGEHRQFRCLHVLEQLDPAKENGFRWHCLKPDCGKFMYRKNGVVARMLSSVKSPGTVSARATGGGRTKRVAETAASQKATGQALRCLAEKEGGK